MEKPSVIIDLAPHLHDFLYHEFKCKKEGSVTINSTNDIGKYIQSMISISALPVKPVITDNSIVIILPIQEWNHYILSHNFLQVVKWKENMIHSFLEAAWRTRVREYFITGYEKGYNQDHIINAFLMAYNIKKNKFTYDQIKKIDYRNRRKMNKEVADDIQLSLFE